MGLIIGFITILLVGFLIIRGYNAKGVLFVGGVGLLLIAVALGKAIGGEKSTGLFFVDISNLIFSLMEKRGGGLGLLIMVLIGFSAYMSHIGANDTVIRVLSRPLGHIRSPYFLLLGAFFIGSLLSFAISSATALGAFLMATLFPILTNLGISRPSAAADCAGCGAGGRAGRHSRQRLRLQLHDSDERAGDSRHRRRAFLLATVLRPQRRPAAAGRWRAHPDGLVRAEKSADLLHDPAFPADRGYAHL